MRIKRIEIINYKDFPLTKLDYPLNVFRYISGTDAPLVSYPISFLEECMSSWTSPTQWKVLTAFFLEGFGLKDASAKLNIKEAAVRIYLRDALQRISFQCERLKCCNIPTPRDHFEEQIHNAGFSTRLTDWLLHRTDREDYEKEGFWNYEKTLDENILSKTPSDFLNYYRPYRHSSGFGQKSLDELQDYMHRKGYNWGEEYSLLKLEKKKLRLSKAQSEIERLEMRIRKLKKELGDTT